MKNLYKADHCKAWNPTALIITLVLGLSWVSPTAFAGGGMDTGGGDVIACNKRSGINPARWFIGKPKYRQVYLADTFSIHNWVNESFRRVPLAQMKRIIYSALNENTPGLGDDIKNVIENVLRFKYLTKRKEIREFIPNLPDDDIDPETLPRGCAVEQLAVQRISEKTVYVNNNYLIHLGKAEEFLFHVHEAFIYIRNEPGLSTLPIRKKIEEIFGDLSLAQIIQKIITDEKLQGLEYTSEEKLLIALATLAIYRDGYAKDEVARLRHRDPVEWLARTAVMKISPYLKPIVKEAHYSSWDPQFAHHLVHTEISINFQIASGLAAEYTLPEVDIVLGSGSHMLAVAQKMTEIGVWVLRDPDGTSPWYVHDDKVDAVNERINELLREAIL